MRAARAQGHRENSDSRGSTCPCRLGEVNTGVRGPVANGATPTSRPKAFRGRRPEDPKRAMCARRHLATRGVVRFRCRFEGPERAGGASRKRAFEHARGTRTIPRAGRRIRSARSLSEASSRAPRRPAQRDRCGSAARRRRRRDASPRTRPPEESTRARSGWSLRCSGAPVLRSPTPSSPGRGRAGRRWRERGAPRRSPS